MYSRVLPTPRPSPHAVTLYSAVTNDFNSKTARRCSVS